MSGRRGRRGVWCRQRQRAPHDVGERCTSTPHTARKRTARARTARAGTAGARNASMGSASAHKASMHMHSRYTQREHGRRKRDNASMYSTSTKHGPAHPRDVESLSTTLTSGCRTIWANAAQVHHTPSTKAHSSSTHRMGTRSRHGLEHAHVDDKLHEYTVHTVRARRAHRAKNRSAAQRGYARGAQGAHARTWCMFAMSCSACVYLSAPRQCCLLPERQTFPPVNEPNHNTVMMRPIDD